MTHRRDQDTKEWDTGWVSSVGKLREGDAEGYVLLEGWVGGKSTEPGIRGLGFELSLGFLLTTWPW